MEAAAESVDAMATAAHEVETALAAMEGEHLETNGPKEQEAPEPRVKMEADAMEAGGMATEDFEDFLDDLMENADAITEAVGGVNGSNGFSSDSNPISAEVKVRVKTEPPTSAIDTSNASGTFEAAAPSNLPPAPVIRVKTELTQTDTRMANSSGTVSLEENRPPRPSIRIKSDLMTPAPVKNEVMDEAPDLPDNFFDDLMEDPAGRRADEIAFNALSLKRENIGSQLQQLDELERRKKQKKQKSKKKSKKRSRTGSPERVAHKRKRNSRHDNIDPMAFNIDSFENDISGRDFVEAVTGSNNASGRVDTGYKEIMLKKVEDSIENTIEDDFMEILTPSGKQMRSVDWATKAIRELKRQHTPLSSVPLQYSRIVRKKPNLDPSVNYRSPMHKRCMQFRFNSLDRRIDYSFWGLQTLAPSTAASLRVIGADLDMLNDMLKTMKLPEQLNAAEFRAVVEIDAESEEEGTCSLYRNVMTQTEKGKTHDIGLMTRPFCASHGTQTADGGGSVSQLARGNESLMRMFEALNPTQFLALADFTELLLANQQEPMELYGVRQRLMEIFTSAEKQTTEVAPPPPRAHRLADPRIAAQRPPPLLPEPSAGRYVPAATFEYAPPPPPLTVQHAMPVARRHAMPVPQQHQVIPPAPHHAISTAQHHPIPVLQSRALPSHVPNCQPYGAPAFYATQTHPQMPAIHNSEMMPNPLAHNNAYYQRRH